jgi:hypothetical protein
MANHIRGEVAIESNGQTYTLVMNTDAMVQFLSVFHRPEKRAKLVEALHLVGQSDPEYVRAFIWAAARRYHPDLTIEDASRLIDGAGGLLGLNKQLTEVAASMGPDPADAPTAGTTGDDGRPIDAQTTAASGIGRRSIANRAKSA